MRSSRAARLAIEISGVFGVLSSPSPVYVVRSLPYRALLFLHASRDPALGLTNADRSSSDMTRPCDWCQRSVFPVVVAVRNLVHSRGIGALARDARHARRWSRGTPTGQVTVEAADAAHPEPPGRDRPGH
jgi:hypothetical protein